MKSWLVAIPVVTALAGCGGGGGVLGSSVQGLQSGDVPSGWTHCPQSGDVTKITDKDTAGEWQYQQQHGATGGDIEVYADSSGDCKGMPDLGSGSGSGKTLASAVIHYKDQASADAATNGMFGANAKTIPGATTGSATGFGANSAYIFTSSVGLVLWEKGTSVAAVVGMGVSESDFKKAANGVKGRV